MSAKKKKLPKTLTPNMAKEGSGKAVSPRDSAFTAVDSNDIVYSDKAPFIEATNSNGGDNSQPLNDAPVNPPLVIGRRSQQRKPAGLDIHKDIHEDGLVLRHHMQNIQTEVQSPKTPGVRKKKRVLRNQSSAERPGSVTYGPDGTTRLSRRQTLETAAYENLYNKDGEGGELFEPDLVNRTVRHVCYAEDPVFRLETINGKASWVFFIYIYFLPLASFFLDITKIVPETGRTPCHGYFVGRALILGGILVVSMFFAVSNRLLRRGWGTWEVEQYYLSLVLVVLMWENGRQLFKLALEELDLVCDDDFDLQHFADLRFLRLLNFAYNYISLETFQHKKTGIGASVFVTVTSVAEFVFLWVYPLSDQDAFTYNAEQWFETMRILLLAHRGYLAYMNLSKRSYLRTRSRQLGFWAFTGPLAVECFFRLCGRQLVNLYNIQANKSLSFNSFLGEVCTTELRYLAFAIVFGAPFQCERRQPTVRIIRSEKSCIVHSSPGNYKGERRLLHRRNNLFSRSFGLESVNRDLDQLSKHTRPSFCLETAVWAFNCSYLVYFDDPSSKAKGRMPGEELRKVDLEVCKFIHHKETSSFACIFRDTYKPHRLFVAFRGTASLTDVKTDIKAWAKYVQFGQDEDNCFWVHQGFYSAYKPIGALVRMELHNVIKDLLSSGSQPEDVWVVFCGHSLGGAHATLMAVDTVDQLQASGITNIKVYTYGAPRVGDGQFADYANSRISEMFRIVGSGDPVPRVPGQRTGCLLLCLGLPLCLKLLSSLTGRRRGVLLFYRHVGYEMVINGTNIGDLIADPLAVEYHFYLSWMSRPTEHLFTAYRAGMLSAIFQLRGEDDPQVLEEPENRHPKDTE